MTPEENVPGQEQATQTADSPAPYEQSNADQDLGFTQPALQPAEPEPSPPSRSTRRTDPPSVPRSGSRNSSPSISPAPRAEQVRAKGERPSVRAELREITAMLRAAEPVVPKPKTPIRIHRGQAR